MRFRPAPLLSILAIAGCGALCALGLWQWSRFDEKTAAFAVIAARADLAPLANGAVVATPDLEFRQIDGAVVDSSVSAKLFGAGARTFQRVRLGDDRLVLAETGMAAALPEGASVRGVLRLMHRDTALPADAPEKGEFFAPGPGLAVALGADPGFAGYIAATAVVTPTGHPRANPYADPRASAASGPERHLGYALTWFGLAIAWLGVALALHARMGRLTLRST